MEKLQRQRALLQEHLRWLESEIATEASSALTPQRPEPTPPASAATACAATPGSTAIPAVPEVPEADVRGIHSEVRSGCLLYFSIAIVTLGVVVGFIYWRY